jgi:hypothetical protein
LPCTRDYSNASCRECKCKCNISLCLQFLCFHGQ